MNTTVQFRTDSVTKRKAQKIAEQIGLYLSAVFNATLKQMIRVGGLPFTLLTDNGLTSRQENEMLREIGDAHLRGVGFTTAKEMHASILAEK